jgi:hypothetical protein
MKTVVILFMINALFLSCNSQEIKSKHSKSKKPHVSYKVTKKYDENGNLIELDSVYTSYYSNIEGDTLNTDSIMTGFSEYFDNAFSQDFSNRFYSVDSMLMPGFFHQDFFEKQFLDQSREMLELLQQLDSLKNSYFQMHSKKSLSKK